MSTMLVVGGTGGVGTAVVRAAVAAGQDVVFTFFRARQAAEALLAECGDGPGRSRAARLDLRQPEAIRGVVGSCGDDLTHVVFAAASGVWRELHDVRQRHWNFTTDINGRGLMLLYQASLPALVAASGSLVVITSLGGAQVIPSYGLIGMTKAMTEAFVRYAACEAGPSGVRVNAVAPGLMDTKALRGLADIDDHLARVATQTPLRRLVTPEDVAALVGWLASPAAGMITGQTFVVDGGRSLLADPAQSVLVVGSATTT